MVHHQTGDRLQAGNRIFELAIGKRLLPPRHLGARLSSVALAEDEATSFGRLRPSQYALIEMELMMSKLNAQNLEF